MSCSFHAISTYHHLHWLENLRRMTPNKLTLTVLFADIDSRGHRGRPQNTWNALIQKDIKALSEEQGLWGILIKW